MNLLWALILAFMVCLCALPWAMTAADRINLVDEPTERKRHLSSTPLVGGVCIYFAVVVGLYFSQSSVSWTILFWFGLVLIVGVIDDYADISHSIRLIAHTCIILGVSLTDGSIVSEIGAVFGNDNIRFVGVSAIVFTVIGVLGAVNAVNMSDGVDGLLGSIVSISLITILLLASTRIQNPDLFLFSTVEIVAVLGACFAFLVVNSRVMFKKAMVFLGDAGSTTLGFLLIYILIDFTQGSKALFSPVLAGWIVGLPLLDASAVIIKRILAGKSPFRADRSHLHHILLDRGYAVNRTVVVLCCMHTSMIAIAVAIERSGIPWSDAILFWGFVALVLVRVAALNTTSDAMSRSKVSQQPTLDEIVGTSNVETSSEKKESAPRIAS